MGKTALACQLTYNVAERGGGVFYASLEMPVALLTPRLASSRLWMPGSHSVLDYQRIIRGQVDDQEMRWIESAAKEMKSWPFIIDDAPGLLNPLEEPPSETHDRSSIHRHPGTEAHGPLGHRLCGGAAGAGRCTGQRRFLDLHPKYGRLHRR